MNRNRIRTATLIAALAISATACGNNDLPRTNAPVKTAGPNTTATGAPVTPTAVPSPGDTEAASDPFYGIELTPFTGAAADQFGADRVMEAYKHFVRFESTLGWNGTLASKRAEQVRDIDFSFVEKYMTPAGYAAWQQNVTTRATNEDSQRNLLALVAYGLSNDEFVAKTDPLVTNQVIDGPAVTDVDTIGTQKRLVMTFTLKAEVRGKFNGKDIRSPLTRRITFWAVPGGQPDVPWLIDAWEGTLTTSDTLIPDEPK